MICDKRGKNLRNTLRNAMKKPENPRNFPKEEKLRGLSQKIQAMYFKIQGTYFKICALYFSL